MKRVFKSIFAGFLLVCSASAQNTTIYGVELPEDAVPYEEQVLRMPCDNTRNETTFDFATSVYQRICVNALDNLFQDTLIDLEPNARRQRTLRFLSS